ncbi:hypothetical protein PMAYCL1PPCAC_20132 [Pristionchus mayeri]|uniref:Uncharacterized protein n=1 Tax=Pristionchus mayeri TaxID=1317129 RepID=A0AAN5CSS4_9BILA|nr:hypothetical protein PMAYCL1PPCAC_20132 [Pristionchus mayeri]
MLLLLCFGLLFVGVNAEAKEPMERQCLCKTEFQPCLVGWEPLAEDCGKKCSQHVTKMGGSFEKVRACVMAEKARFYKGVACVHREFGKVCADEPGAEVPRRFPETLELAAVREVTRQLTNAGLLSEATKMFSAPARKAIACGKDCAKQTKCYKIKCSLKLPSDNDIIKTVIKCGQEVGVDEPVAKKFCGCLVDAGIEQLKPFCPKIVFTPEP